MVEFGEQLRRAREEKGMTQQSLAEKLYVTRQSVSRWECGDRYPDLLTTKRISQILDVSLDDLLSEKEMSKVVERNPVIENKTGSNITIALYAFVVFSFLVTVVDTAIRFPFQAGKFDYHDILVLGLRVFGSLVQIAVFSFGFVHAIKGALSPKRMGAVIAAFFGSVCLTSSNLLVPNAPWQMIAIDIVFMFPYVLGVIASFLFFIQDSKCKAWPYIIYLAAAWGTFRILFSTIQLMVHGSAYLSMNTTVNLVLQIAIYGLIIYQTRTLVIKLKKRDIPNIV